MEKGAARLMHPPDGAHPFEEDYLLCANSRPRTASSL